MKKIKNVNNYLYNSLQIIMSWPDEYKIQNIGFTNKKTKN